MTATHSVGRPRPAVDLMPAYRPGKGAAQAEAEHGITNAIKLASNENPLPPIQSIVDAVAAAATGANRYADHRATAVRERLATRLDLDVDQVTVGAGSVGLLAATVPDLRRPGRRGRVSVAFVRGLPGVHPADGRRRGHHSPDRGSCVRSRRRRGGRHASAPSWCCWRRPTTRRVRRLSTADMATLLDGISPADDRGDRRGVSRVPRSVAR